MVAVLAMSMIVLLATAAELLHRRSCSIVAGLAFGPTRRPARWTIAQAPLRVLALGALTWGLTTLLMLEPKVQKARSIPENKKRHLLLALDVSPSMRLRDAGPSGKQSRLQRAADLLASFFQRVPMDLYRTTVIAVYNGAKPVVLDTSDLAIVRNILDDLPMHYAFEAGDTDLFAGLKEAGQTARPWRPSSTILMMVSDGDTVPATGMPKIPASIGHVVIVGVGNPFTGTFIDGRQSRQDVSTLRQIATRLGGAYHDGNQKHLSTALLRRIARSADANPLERLTRREYALLACALGSLVLSILPMALYFAGTSFRPGVRTEAPPHDRKAVAAMT